MKTARKQRTRSRIRTRVDMSRVAAGLKTPGIDPRTWVAFARVDEDPDATVWDAEWGWICDVTIVGGPLDGDGPIVCRMPTRGQGNGVGEQHPPRQGGLVVVAIPEGNTNADCIIIGQLHDVDHVVPATVNGTTIDEPFATRTHILAYPGEDFDAEFENVRLTGQMVLGVPDADQPYARGNDLADALNALADAFDAFLDAAPAPPGAFGSVAAPTFTAAAVPLKVAIEQFKLSRDQYLSTRIKGT